MGEQRVLTLAVVTEIHDNHIAYPSCSLCYTKLLVDPVTTRYHCLKCGSSQPGQGIEWRYRLVMSVSDGTVVGKVVVFGHCLDGFFGKKATEFNKSLTDLERTGYPTSSMLKEALRRTFLGKYFYFGFKLMDYNGSTNLSDIFTMNVQSSQQSQLDRSCDFENSHSLACQMLPGNTGVYATVTDHMRLLVKQLRTGVCVNFNSTLYFCDNLEDKKSATPAGNRQSSSNVKTKSFQSDHTFSFYQVEDSVLFSFEINKIASSKKSSLRPLVTPKESFTEMKEYPDKFSFNNEQCIDNFEGVTFEDENDFKSSTFGYKSACETISGYIENLLDMSGPGSGQNLLKDIPVTQKLMFDSQSDVEISMTSIRIDRELQKRAKLSQIVLSQHQTAQHSTKPDVKTVTTSRYPRMSEDNTFTAIIKQTGFEATSARDLDSDKLCEAYELDFGGKKYLTKAANANSHLNICIDELVMPESEDLNAFFDSEDSWTGALEEDFDNDSSKSSTKKNACEEMGVKEIEKAGMIMVMPESEALTKCLESGFNWTSLSDKSKVTCLPSCSNLTQDTDSLQIHGKDQFVEEANHLESTCQKNSSTFTNDILDKDMKCENTHLYSQKHSRKPKALKQAVFGGSDKLPFLAGHLCEIKDTCMTTACTNVSCSSSTSLKNSDARESFDDTEDLESFFNNITEEEENAKQKGDSGKEVNIEDMGRLETHENPDNGSIYCKDRSVVDCDQLSKNIVTSCKVSHDKLSSKDCSISIHQLNTVASQPLNRTNCVSVKETCRNTNKVKHLSDSVYNSFSGTDFNSVLDNFSQISLDAESADCKKCLSMYCENDTEFSKSGVFDNVIYSPSELDSDFNTIKEVPLLSQDLLGPLENELLESEQIDLSSSLAYHADSKTDIETNFDTLKVVKTHQNGQNSSSEIKPITKPNSSIKQDNCTGLPDTTGSLLDESCDEPRASDHDQCIIMESQDLFPLSDKLTRHTPVSATRRVQFDTRLHTVRSCELMDVKMKLNKDSPVECLQTMSPRKPCIRRPSTANITCTSQRLMNHLVVPSHLSYKNEENTYPTPTDMSRNSFDCSQDLFSSSQDLFSPEASVGCRETDDRKLGEYCADRLAWETTVASPLNESCADLFSTYTESPLVLSYNSHSTPASKLEDFATNTDANGNTVVNSNVWSVSKTNCVDDSTASDLKNDTRNRNVSNIGTTEKRNKCSMLNSGTSDVNKIVKPPEISLHTTPDIFGDSFEEPKGNTKAKPYHVQTHRLAFKTLVLNTPDVHVAYSNGLNRRNEFSLDKNRHTSPKRGLSSSSCTRNQNSLVKNKQTLSCAENMPPCKGNLNNLSFAQNASQDLFEDSPGCDKNVSVPNNAYLLCKKLFF